jgi:Ulp1 family protease
MQNFRPNDQLVEKFDIDITQKKIDCMRDGQWLNR